MSPKKRTELIEAVGHLPDAELDRLIRMALRLLNNDPKADRLMKLHERGQISSEQLLRRM